MRALPILVLLVLTASTAAAEVEILDVSSETGGVWAPGRFSTVLVRVRATPGDHEIRARLETDKIAVARFSSAGGEETVRLALLPERDAVSVEIDVGEGFQPHDLLLRRSIGDTPIVGVPSSLITEEWVAKARDAYAWRQIALPGDGGPAVLRDLCDAVIRPDSTRERLDAALERRAGGPRTGDSTVGRWLYDRAAGAAVSPERARGVLLPLAVLAGLLLGLVVLGRRGGWHPGLLVLGVIAAAMGAIFLWLTIGNTDDRPRVAVRGYRVLRTTGETEDYLVAAARGVETTDLRAPAGTILRPIPDATGRIGPYVLEDGRILREVSLGRGRLAFLRIDRDRSGEMEIPVEDAFFMVGDRGCWLGKLSLPGDADGPAIGRTEPLAGIWERFREKTGSRPLNDRGRLLRKIVRPATRTGVYGFLPSPPPLDAEAMGVETAELLWCVVVP